MSYWDFRDTGWNELAGYKLYSTSVTRLLELGGIQAVATPRVCLIKHKVWNWNCQCLHGEGDTEEATQVSLDVLHRHMRIIQ